MGLERIAKPKVQETVVHNKCGKPSGWTNSDLRKITQDARLRCGSCGQFCITVLTKAKASVKVTEESYITPKSKKNYVKDLTF